MPDDNREPNPRLALIGLLALVALIVATLFLVHRLNQAARIQDCVMSGRTNCAPIETPPRQHNLRRISGSPQANQ